MKTLESLRQALHDGSVKSRDLVEECLDNIEDSSGEGRQTFLYVDIKNSRQEADTIDAARASGKHVLPYAGIPISVKDLFDVKDQKTLAGSRVLNRNEPAQDDSTVVARLRAAGFIIIGRTNMTEFAYSGLGLNPHFGTPRNPYDRDKGRIPGGSSSGAAVSITDGMSFAALGTDTGGSCRIPAAMSGIVGYKPTQSQIPQRGMLPLSSSFDSIGTLANSVTCCKILDDILSGNPPELPASTVRLKDLQIGKVTHYVLDDMDANVAQAYDRVLSLLSNEGCNISDLPFPELYDIPENFKQGGLTAIEAYHWHKDRLAKYPGDYDPRVSTRILKGKDQKISDYLELLESRQRLIESAEAVTGAFDAVILPTVPIIAPRFSELENDDDYNRINLLALRNPMVANFLDRCAISIPVHETGSAPVGLMLMGENHGDEKLFNIAVSIEKIINKKRY